MARKCAQVTSTLHRESAAAPGNFNNFGTKHCITVMFCWRVGLSYEHSYKMILKIWTDRAAIDVNRVLTTLRCNYFYGSFSKLICDHCRRAFVRHLLEEPLYWLWLTFFDFVQIAEMIRRTSVSIGIVWVGVGIVIHWNFVAHFERLSHCPHDTHCLRLEWNRKYKLRLKKGQMKTVELLKTQRSGIKTTRSLWFYSLPLLLVFRPTVSYFISWKVQRTVNL